MGLLRPAKWLGKLLRGHRSASAKAGPSTSSSVQTTNIAAFPLSSHTALRRLVSHASLHNCRQAPPGVTKTTAFGVHHQPAVDRAHRREPSIDLQQFLRSDAAGSAPYSEDIANRNILAQQFDKDGPNSNPLWRPEDVYQTYATYDPHQLRKRLYAKGHELLKAPSRGFSDDRKEARDADALPYCPDSDQKSTFSGDAVRRPSEATSWASSQDVVYASIISLPSRLRSLSRKRSVLDLRLARELGHKRSQSFPGAWPRVTATRPSVTKADLDKPLPPLPRLDDTTVHTKCAPAVTHHTIQRDVHEVHQEHITNEFHQDEYQHRVLPVMDYEILPARHFVQLDGGGLEEIPEEDIRGGLPSDLEQRISEAAATLFPAFRDSGVSFTSTHSGADPVPSSEHGSITAEGHARRDTTWTYPSTFLPLQNGADQHHRLFVHLDGADAGAGSAHIRSLSDGPPIIPPRGVRHVGVASVASL